MEPEDTEKPIGVQKISADFIAIKYKEAVGRETDGKTGAVKPPTAEKAVKGVGLGLAGVSRQILMDPKMRLMR
jgi:hypothetical protein